MHEISIFITKKKKKTTTNPTKIVIYKIKKNSINYDVQSSDERNSLSTVMCVCVFFHSLIDFSIRNLAPIVNFWGVFRQRIVHFALVVGRFFKFSSNFSEIYRKTENKKLGIFMQLHFLMYLYVNAFSTQIFLAVFWKNASVFFGSARITFFKILNNRSKILHRSIYLVSHMITYKYRTSVVRILEFLCCNDIRTETGKKYIFVLRP